MILLPRRHWPQPQGPVGIDSGSELSAGLLFASAGCWGSEQGTGPRPPNGFVGDRAASPIGTGFGFTGTNTQYARFDTRISVAAADPVTVEAWVIGSAFPSLSAIMALSSSSATNGTIAGVSGSLRGALAYTGTAPCDVYAWGGSQDYDTNAPFVVDTPQHIVAAKAAGTGAVTWTVYRNGRLLASGNSTNAAAWQVSGPHWYVGGRHPSGTAPITGVIVKTAFYNRVLTPAEVQALQENPWQVFEPRTARIYSFPSGASSGTTVAVPKASLVLTGHAPTVATTANVTVSVPKGSLVLTGYAPSVLATDHKTISVPKGALVLRGYAPTVLGTVVAATNRGSYSEPDRRLRERLRKLAIQQAHIEDDEEAVAILLATIMREYRK